MINWIRYLHDAWYREYVRCKRAGGESLDYGLSSSSVVVDAGVFHGQFSRRVIAKFGCKVIGFEPVKEYAEEARKVLGDLAVVYNVGLSSRDESVEFNVDETASSAFVSGKRNILVNFRDVCQIFVELDLKHIDFLILNIEGSEYDVLERLIDTSQIRSIKNISVQFHKTIPQYQLRYNRLVERLSHTHSPNWQYLWVWESRRLS